MNSVDLFLNILFFYINQFNNSSDNVFIIFVFCYCCCHHCCCCVVIVGCCSVPVTRCTNHNCKKLSPLFVRTTKTIFLNIILIEQTRTGAYSCMIQWFTSSSSLLSLIVLFYHYSSSLSFPPPLFPLQKKIILDIDNQPRQQTIILFRRVYKVCLLKPTWGTLCNTTNFHPHTYKIVSNHNQWELVVQIFKTSSTWNS